MIKFLILICMLIILISAYYIKIKIFSPTGIFIAMWTVFLFVSVFVWKPEYEWNYCGVFWILSACFCCEVGELFGRSFKMNYRFCKKSDINTFLYNRNLWGKSKEENRAWNILFVLLLLSIIRIFTDMINYGYTLSDLFDWTSLMAKNEQVTYNRYFSDVESKTLFGQVMGMFMYVLPLWGGYCFVLFKTIKKKIVASVVVFIPILLEVLFTTAKSGFIASVMLWVIGFIFGKIYKQKRNIKIKKRYLFLILIFIMIVLLLLYSFMVMRVHDTSQRTLIEISQKFMNYGFGSVPAFDNWLGNYYELSYGFGINTFLGISSKLGLLERIQGVYGMLPGFSGSNVFTAFRALIDDFGIIGGLFAVAFIGAVSGYCQKRIVNSVFCPWYIVLLYSATFFYVSWSFVCSTWVYVSYILVPIVFAALFLLVESCNAQKYRYKLKLEVRQ